MREALDTAEFVDHHCHGVTGTPGGVLEFEQCLTEARDPMLFGQRYIDGPLGMALLALCPPVLDLPQRPSIEDYVARRAELGDQEVARRFLSAARLSALIVDTGYACEETTPAQLGAMAGCASHVVHRIETIAEGVLRDRPGGADFAEALREELRAAGSTGVGFKSIVAYRGGFGVVTRRPGQDEIELACSRLRGEAEPLTDPVLVRHVLYETLEVASERGLPIQFHVGYGDEDLDLRSANPLQLEPFIREAREHEVPVVLLHCYPYHREAGFLASIFPNVFFDIGLTIPHVGLEGDRILAETMEVAPFAKLLYSSDAARLPEFYYLASRLFRRAAGTVLERWVGSGMVQTEDALRVFTMIGSGNARRVYAGLAPA